MFLRITQIYTNQNAVLTFNKTTQHSGTQKKQSDLAERKAVTMGRPTSLVLFLFIFGKISLSVKGKARLTIVFSRMFGVRVVCDLFPPGNEN